jgi:hypothetical protein
LVKFPQSPVSALRRTQPGGIEPGTQALHVRKLAIDPSAGMDQAASHHVNILHTAFEGALHGAIKTRTQHSNLPDQIFAIRTDEL